MTPARVVFRSLKVGVVEVRLLSGKYQGQFRLFFRDHLHYFKRGDKVQVRLQNSEVVSIRKKS